MPQEPKRRHSRERQGKRRASIKLNIPKPATCKNCGSPILPHIICSQCGFYKERQAIPLKKKHENLS